MIIQLSNLIAFGLGFSAAMIVCGLFVMAADHLDRRRTAQAHIGKHKPERSTQ
jgi:hypothetical protein